MDYVIIQAATIDELQKKVIEYLNKKYQLAGGVACSTPLTSKMTYIQAVYKTV